MSLNTNHLIAMICDRKPSTKEFKIKTAILKRLKHEIETHKIRRSFNRSAEPLKTGATYHKVTRLIGSIDYWIERLTMALLICEYAEAISCVTEMRTLIKEVYTACRCHAEPYLISLLDDTEELISLSTHEKTKEGK